MRLRSRLLALLPLLAAWFLVPAQVAVGRRAELGLALVDDWLSGSRSPLPILVHAGTMPTIEIDLRTSPPTTDPDRSKALVAVCNGTVAAWAKRSVVQVAGAAQGSLPLLIRVGEHGVQADMQLLDGGNARFAQALPNRWHMLPLFAMVGGALLGLPGWVWLFVGSATALAMCFATALTGTVGVALHGVVAQVLTFGVPLRALPILAMIEVARSHRGPSKHDFARRTTVFVSAMILLAAAAHVGFDSYLGHCGPAMHLGVLIAAMVAAVAVGKLHGRWAGLPIAYLGFGLR